MDAVKRVGEVGHGICGGDGAGAGAEGCYRASMDDGWRVCIAFGVLPRSLHSFRRALISALGSRLGDQVAVSSSRWGTRIFVYAPSAGSADEAAQVAREVLARRDVSAPVRTEFWSVREQEWRDAADEPSADPVAERQALHEARQERERQASVTSGRPAWEVRVELPSHDDVVRLAGHLAAQGWRVRPHRRHLIVGADCEDDAKSLAGELSGDGGADAGTAFRVRRVDIYPSWTDGGPPLLAAVLDPGRLRVLRPALRAGGPGINMATRKKHPPEQVVRELATADRKAPPRTYTTWTAVAPDLVFTVLACGPSPLYGPPSVRNFSSPGQQTSRSPRRAIGYARILSQVRFHTGLAKPLVRPVPHSVVRDDLWACPETTGQRR